MKTKIMSVREFRSKMSKLLGESKIIVTKDGVPTARVVPLESNRKIGTPYPKNKGCF